jgi:hypothetical protein
LSAFEEGIPKSLHAEAALLEHPTPARLLVSTASRGAVFSTTEVR